MRGKHRERVIPQIFVTEARLGAYVPPVRTADDVRADREKEARLKAGEKISVGDFKSELDKFREDQRVKTRARLALEEEWRNIGNDDLFLTGMNTVRIDIVKIIDTSDRRLRETLVAKGVVSDDFVQGTIQTRILVEGYKADSEKWNQILDKWQDLKGK